MIQADAKEQYVKISEARDTTYTIQFPEYTEYPTEVTMITQKRDRKSPYAGNKTNFTSTSKARRCREQIRMFPRFTCKFNQEVGDEYDETAEHVVKNWLAWKERIFNSLINLCAVEDKISSSGYKHFAERFYDSQMLEARCCEVVVSEVVEDELALGANLCEGTLR